MELLSGCRLELLKELESGEAMGLQTGETERKGKLELLSGWTLELPFGLEIGEAVGLEIGVAVALEIGVAGGSKLEKL